jgi:hypothetical protein
MVNRVGLSQTTLLTFLNFPPSHVFLDGGLGMIWDSHSSNMEKPNANERERAMGFCIGTLGHLKGKEVQIILADDNPILK